MPMQPAQDASRNTTNSVEAAEISRRSALGRIATGGAAGALAISAGSWQAKAAPTLQALTAEDWQQRIGETFRVEGPYANDLTGASYAAEVRLEQVIERRPKSGDPHRPAHLSPCAISLLFSCEQALPNETYVFQHPSLGRSLLFMHDVFPATDADAKIYEVILN